MLRNEASMRIAQDMRGCSLTVSEGKRCAKFGDIVMVARILG
jgi:hypothetical protein